MYWAAGSFVIDMSDSSFVATTAKGAVPATKKMRPHRKPTVRGFSSRAVHMVVLPPARRTYENHWSTSRMTPLPILEQFVAPPAP
jgi:hypothetical protein